MNSFIFNSQLQAMDKCVYAVVVNPQERKKNVVSKETVAPRRWGGETRKLNFALKRVEKVKFPRQKKKNNNDDDVSSASTSSSLTD